MKAWTDIEKALNEELPPEVVQPPNKRLGIHGRWVKGRIIMELANSVFGPDGWSSSVISPPKVEERVVSIHKNGAERHGLIVTVTVQITGRGLDADGNIVEITKTDVGWGTASESYNAQAKRYNPLIPPQFRPAILGAITIGFKRCMSQFGRRLGMQLYVPDEEQIAMGWEEGEAPATQPTRRQGPAPRSEQPPTEAAYPDPGEQSPPPRAASAAPPSPTVERLAHAMNIEVTKDNRAVLVDLAAKELKLVKLGNTQVRLKEVKKQLGYLDGAKVADVHARMPSYAIWMATEAFNKGVEGKQVGQAFKDMADYDMLLRQTQDTRYQLQGGAYEPWPKADIHNPTIMVGARIERAAIKSMKAGLIERFPSDSGDDANPYRMKNHLIGQFQRERIGLLTWEELAAFRLHVMEGAEYPEKWGGRGEDAEELATVPPEPEPVLTEEDKEAGKAVVRLIMATPKPIAEPEPEDDPDYVGQCQDLLMEIQGQLTTTTTVTDPDTGRKKEEVVAYEGLVAFATKQASLASANAFSVVKGIHAAVASGNLKDAKAVETLLTTALKGLSK